MRLCEDRLSLVGECLSGRNKAYRHSSLLQHLASLLRVCGSDARARQARVLTLIAQAALKVRALVYVVFFLCMFLIIHLGFFIVYHKS